MRAMIVATLLGSGACRETDTPSTTTTTPMIGHNPSGHSMSAEDEELLSKMHLAAQFAKARESMFLDIIARGVLVELCQELRPDATAAAANGEMFWDTNVTANALYFGCGEVTLVNYQSVEYSLTRRRWSPMSNKKLARGR